MHMYFDVMCDDCEDTARPIVHGEGQAQGKD